MRRHTTTIGYRLDFWRVRPRGAHTGQTMGGVFMDLLEQFHDRHQTSDFINMVFDIKVDTAP